jgi:signal transduction histidine kinase
MSLQQFETRARTIDHLGRGQIADCPTAVSELWKNAYDAYARHVSLHIFHGSPPMAAVCDDGHGMSAKDFQARWMVIGTESKYDNPAAQPADRFGLPERPRQGEKGIGRLSAAYLGPVTLLISRHEKQPYVAGLVDWRLFENPYLTLSAIRVPVEEFSKPGDLAGLLPQMIRASADNLGDANPRPDPLRHAWNKFSAQESEHGRDTTADRIRQLAGSAGEVTERIINDVLPQWGVWSKEVSHGTILVVIDAGPELTVWVETDRDDDEFLAMRKLLRSTLTGFVDPYSRLPRHDFTYDAVAHTPAGLSTIVSSETVFGVDEFLGLEHYVIGHVDENGVFDGSVRAFGVDQGHLTVSLRQRSPRRAELEPGPFDVCLGTFEFDIARSTHPESIHAVLEKQAQTYAGLAIYRDGLRVMPYGRPEADYFGIEERRSKNVGRAFWSYRRTFGRVALTRSENSNLRDKAGREGLIDNTARRELQRRVIELLQTAARRFFNTDAPTTKELLPVIRERNKLARDAEKKAGRQYRDEFRKKVRTLCEAIEQANTQSARLFERLADVRGRTDLRRFTEIGAEIDRFQSDVDSLAAPPRPKSLGQFEGEYREYRDAYRGLRVEADGLVDTWAELLASMASDPVAVITDVAERHRTQLRRLLNALRGEIEETWTNEVSAKVKADTVADGDKYPTEARPILASLEAGVMRPDQAIRELEGLRSRLHQEFADRYGEVARAFRQLAQGVELAAATLWGEERRLDLENQVGLLTSLAQLGVTVEIVGHEFETIDGRIRANMRHLPHACRDSEAFRGIRTAVEELFGRLRFFGPLQLSGPRQKENVTGETIIEYVDTFFADTFASRRIAFHASQAFRELVVYEFRSRVVPVFLNLVNNAVYWVARADRPREIVFDRVDGAVIVADSGPGVDPDDELSLFQLFFSRRAGGRGVGLYLCRQNLAAGKHSIDYAPAGPCRVLPGANFVIRFQGASNGP